MLGRSRRVHEANDLRVPLDLSSRDQNRQEMNEFHAATSQPGKESQAQACWKSDWWKRAKILGKVVMLVEKRGLERRERLEARLMDVC